MDEDLDLFFRRRHSYSISSSEESDGQIATMKLGRLSIGSVKLVKSGLDDLLSTIDGGKHDYDWLLTPPGTPPCAPSNANDRESSFPALRSSLLSIRSVPATKASRFSVSPADATTTTTTKPARSSSVTRSSVTKASSPYLSGTTRSSSLLNTSSNSVTSCRSLSRPSTPTRQSTSSGSRPSSPSRTTLTRPLTPSKICNNATVIGKLQPNQNPRSSTPTARSQMSGNGISPATRSSSRPSTPTRRSPSIASSLVSERSPSVSRSSTPSSPIVRTTTSRSSAPSSPLLGRASNGRSSAPPSRGSSPGPCARTSLTEYLDIQPNLKTSLPSRPASVGRTRPSSTTIVRANSETSVAGSTNPSRRSSSPVITKGRHSEVPAKQHMYSNGLDAINIKTRKATTSDPPMRRSPKSTTVTESMGFGRNISNKSMEMALRHMDIRHGVGNVRPPSGTSLFPQSLRSSTPKGRLAPLSQCSTITPSNVRISNEGNCTFSNNGIVSGNGTFHQRDSSSELSMLDSFESCRYDMILLNEDSSNTDWLHSLDDKSEKGFVFDHRFEPLPELFDI